MHEYICICEHNRHEISKTTLGRKHTLCPIGSWKIVAPMKVYSAPLITKAISPLGAGDCNRGDMGFQNPVGGQSLNK